MRKIILYLCFLLTVMSCVSHDKYYSANTNYLSKRELSTKRFQKNKEDKILFSLVQTLQNLGFTVNESNKSLGIITASKYEKIEPNIFVSVNNLACTMTKTQNNQNCYIDDYDVAQKTYVTISAKKYNNSIEVRPTFVKIVINNKGVSRTEKFKNISNVYKNFFHELDKILLLNNSGI